MQQQPDSSSKAGRRVKHVFLLPLNKSRDWALMELQLTEASSQATEDHEEIWLASMNRSLDLVDWK